MVGQAIDLIDAKDGIGFEEWDIPLDFIAVSVGLRLGEAVPLPHRHARLVPVPAHYNALRSEGRAHGGPSRGPAPPGPKSAHPKGRSSAKDGKAVARASGPAQGPRTGRGRRWRAVRATGLVAPAIRKR